MSKLPFTIAENAKFGFRANAPVAVVASKTKFSFKSVLLTAIVGAFALGAGIAHADAADLNIFELRLENNGNMYVLDSAMSGDDCVNAIAETSAYIDENGRAVAIPADAPMYCVSM
jgi:hypothetical protein